MKTQKIDFPEVNQFVICIKGKGKKNLYFCFKKGWTDKINEASIALQDNKERINKSINIKRDFPKGYDRFDCLPVKVERIVKYKITLIKRNKNV